MGPNPKMFYAVARAPGLLAGMAYPDEPMWQSIHKMGYRQVVCLTHDKPPYDPTPLGVLYAAHLQDLAGGLRPQRPELEERCIREAVARIVPSLRQGKGVAVHCEGGTGRTGTVLACALKALGVTPTMVLRQMNTVNEARKKYDGWKGWPESVWQQDLFDRF